MGAMPYFGSFTLVQMVLFHFLGALFTGLMLVVVIPLVVRRLRVRGVIVKFEIENRDQDHSD